MNDTENILIEENVEVKRHKRKLSTKIIISAIFILFLIGEHFLSDAITTLARVKPIKYLGEYTQGYVKFEQNKFFGILDDTGEIVVPCIYEEIKPFTDGVSKGELNGKWITFDNIVATSKPTPEFEHNYTLNKCSHYFRVGISQIRSGLYKDAEESLLIAYEIHPENELIEEYIITAYEKQDDTEELELFKETNNIVVKSE